MYCSKCGEEIDDVDHCPHCDESAGDESGDWWKPILVLTISANAFGFGGVWIGIIVTFICLYALGWEDRHKGPFPTNKHKDS